MLRSKMNYAGEARWEVGRTPITLEKRALGVFASLVHDQSFLTEEDFRTETALRSDGRAVPGGKMRTNQVACTSGKGTEVTLTKALCSRMLFLKVIRKFRLCFKLPPTNDT